MSDRRAQLRSLFMGLVISMLATHGASGDVITVNRFFDAIDPNPGDGFCGEFKFTPPVGGTYECTLRAAIQEINGRPDNPDVDTILVPAGTYELSLAGAGEDLAATGDLDITGDVLITAVGGPAIVDAKGIDRVFDIFASDACSSTFFECVELSGLVIRGGNAAEGGGVRLRSGRVIVSDSRVLSNQANVGGAIYIDDGIQSLWSVTLRHNTALISAGAIFNDGTLELLESTLTGNSAGQTAGGLVNNHFAFLQQTTLSDNPGGEIHNDTVAGLELDHVTVKNDLAYALENLASSPWRSRNSLLIGGCSGTGLLNDDGGNLESPGNSCGLAPTLNQVNVSDPGLRPLAGYGGPTETHALRSDSPARDAGLGSCAFDQRQAPRADGLCDVGAFEYGASPPDGGIFSHGFESGDTAPWSP